MANRLRQVGATAEQRAQVYAEEAASRLPRSEPHEVRVESGACRTFVNNTQAEVGEQRLGGERQRASRWCRTCGMHEEQHTTCSTYQPSFLTSDCATCGKLQELHTPVARATGMGLSTVHLGGQTADVRTRQTFILVRTPGDELRAVRVGSPLEGARVVEPAGLCSVAPAVVERLGDGAEVVVRAQLLEAWSRRGGPAVPDDVVRQSGAVLRSQVEAQARREQEAREARERALREAEERERREEEARQAAERARREQLERERLEREEAERNELVRQAVRLGVRETEARGLTLGSLRRRVQQLIADERQREAAQRAVDELVQRGLRLGIPEQILRGMPPDELRLAVTNAEMAQRARAQEPRAYSTVAADLAGDLPPVGVEDHPRLAAALIEAVEAFGATVTVSSTRRAGVSFAPGGRVPAELMSLCRAYREHIFAIQSGRSAQANERVREAMKQVAESVVKRDRRIRRVS